MNTQRDNRGTATWLTWSEDVGVSNIFLLLKLYMLSQECHLVLGSPLSQMYVCLKLWGCSTGTRSRAGTGSIGGIWLGGTCRERVGFRWQELVWEPAAPPARRQEDGLVADASREALTATAETYCVTRGYMEEFLWYRTVWVAVWERGVKGGGLCEATIWLQEHQYR